MANSVLLLSMRSIDLYPVRGRHTRDEEEEEEDFERRGYSTVRSGSPTVQYAVESGDEATPFLLKDTSNDH